MDMQQKITIEAKSLLGNLKRSEYYEDATRKTRKLALSFAVKHVAAKHLFGIRVGVPQLHLDHISHVVYASVDLIPILPTPRARRIREIQESQQVSSQKYPVDESLCLLFDDLVERVYTEPSLDL